jgi:replication factor C subunit 1
MTSSNVCRYNSKNHPMPFMKASTVFAPKMAKKEVPDLEDANVEEDEEAEDAAKGPVPEDEEDMSKDKYIKAPKKKAAPKSATGKGKKRGIEEDEDAEMSEAKKTKGKGRGKK